MYQPPNPGTGTTKGPLSPICDWPTLLQRFYASEQMLQQVTSQLQTLQKQLDDVRSKPPLHIEYHFDQLKVNRLEGTLNVGITPQGMPDIESLETPGNANWSVGQAPAEDAGQEEDDPLGSMQNEMVRYMDSEGTQALIALESRYGIALDEDHRAKVVQDVKGQLRERVRYYVTMKPYPDKGTVEEKRQWADEIKSKTTRDINGAFSAYLQRIAPPERKITPP
ncbi:MAG: hypothetical protein J7559_02980 [Cohnella sp.]|nr:hypothetical protein [Cohnella sp.]